MNAHILIGIGVFFVTILLVEGVYFVLRLRRRPDAKRVSAHLKKLSRERFTPSSVELERHSVLSNIPWFNLLLHRISPVRRMEHLLESAGTHRSLGFYLLLGSFLGALVVLGGAILKPGKEVVFLFALMAALSPIYFLRVKKRKRAAKFQRQLPEALELIARALRAGHAFTAGLKMAADEFDDPVGTEFSKTIDEINFGVGIQDALRNMASRVDCPDIDFFVISVIIQRETGGNLAEIIERIGHLIRERFKLFGLIKTLSAEGKISAIILVAVPFFISFYFYIVQPTYIGILFTDPIGQAMAMAAAASMMVGIIMMRRMIRFKV